MQGSGLFPISVASSFQERPVISFDGNNYLIAWDDGRYAQFGITSWMFLTLVSQSGTVLYPEGIPIWDTTLWARLTTFGDATYGGDYHLLVWNVLDDQMRNIQVRGARVSTANGVIQTIDPRDGFLIDDNASAWPACAYDGNNYFVVYGCGSNRYGIWGSRITQQAVVLDHIQIDDDGSFPDVSFNGSIYLVVWQEDNTDIYGARVSCDGVVLDPNGIPIVAQSGAQIKPKVSFDSSNWLVVWEDVDSGDLYGAYVNADGQVGNIFPVSVSAGPQYAAEICHGPEDLMLVTFTGLFSQTNTNRIWVKFLGDHTLWTDDQLALAYNNNRHLARKPNSDELHLVYTNGNGIAYRYSPNGGKDWTLPVRVGTGVYPALCLDSQNNPCLTWTNGNMLYYSRKTSAQGWQTNQYTFGLDQPSHPVIFRTSSELVQAESIHILLRLYNPGLSSNSITELRFPINNPTNYQTLRVEQSSGLNMVTLDFPSLAGDYTNTLHATWMHGDTIYYGTRALGSRTWTGLTNPFNYYGCNSAHPFVETYGDSVFVVWQNEADAEVYRAGKHLTQPFYSSNLSLTPTTPSIYPVNASGLVTTFVDKILPLAETDIFWKTYPAQPLHNLSNTPDTRSVFPHSSLRFYDEQSPPVYYTLFLEGNTPYYEIRSVQTLITQQRGYRGITQQPAYFVTTPGYITPSLHLVQRDSFISNWQVPVDIGRPKIKYRFQLNPASTYRLRAIVYHQQNSRWSITIKMDGVKLAEVEYDPWVPETLDLAVPPGLYADSSINVVFECNTGSFASVGPIYVYQYEGEPAGIKNRTPSGTMSKHCLSTNHDISMALTPNPFCKYLTIQLQPRNELECHINIYDVTGRLVKSIYRGMVNNIQFLNWDGKDTDGRTVAPGVYFVCAENPENGLSLIKKAVYMH